MSYNLGPAANNWVTSGSDCAICPTRCVKPMSMGTDGVLGALVTTKTTGTMSTGTAMTRTPVTAPFSPSLRPRLQSDDVMLEGRELILGLRAGVSDSVGLADAWSRAGAGTEGELRVPAAAAGASGTRP